MTETLGQREVAALRTAAQAVAAGDQVAPSAVLWLDSEPVRNDTVRWLTHLHSVLPRKRVN